MWDVEQAWRRGSGGHGQRSARMGRPGAAAAAGWIALSAFPACQDPPPATDDDSADDDSAAPGDDDATATEEDASEVVSQDLPAAMQCRESYPGRVTMKNVGTAAWTRADGYKLGAVDDEDPFYTADTRVWLPEDAVVAPGASTTFEIPLLAPSLAAVYATDWQMVKEGVHWFGAIARQDVEVGCDLPAPRPGVVRLEGNTFADDLGPFVALGATMMWGAWGYRNDRAKLERNLEFLALHGFDYVRALGVVGDPVYEDYWDGREIDETWPDYDAVIAGFTDLAYDHYGLRVEWTLIGDGQVAVPTTSEKYALTDRFVAMAAGREHKIIHFEIANEYWQNGFDGEEGLEELRALTSYVRDRTSVLVAASAPAGVECSDAQAVYGGGVADLATAHFDRDVSTVEGGWRPVRQPWEWVYCEDVPIATNNEPIGPGSSVNTEKDPVKLVAAAVTTWVANLPGYVFHSHAGVRGDEEIYDEAGAGSFLPTKSLVPPDLPSWERQNAHWSDSPFLVYAEDTSGNLYPDTMWVDLWDPRSGAVRAYGDVLGDDFFVFPIGILDHVRMEARRDLEVEVVDPMTGASLDARALAAGEAFDVSGQAALVLRGRYL